jgi:hypothetical protein
MSQGGAVTYLIIGVDQRTLAPWQENVLAQDVPTATRVAETHAAVQGVKLVVAAVIGPYSSVLADTPVSRRAA